MTHKGKKRLFTVLGIIAGVCTLLVVVFFNYRVILGGVTMLNYRIKGFPQDKVLLVGSSYMQFWRKSAEDLSPVETINVAVAGTAVAQWKKWVDSLVVPFHPRGILLYMGSNDINGKKNSKSGDATAAELTELVGLIHEKLPKTEIYYISIAPIPTRWHVWQDTDRCNKLMAALAAELPYFHFIDCTAALLGPDGKPPEEIFIRDRTHLNPEGYRIWAGVISPVIKGAFAN